MLTMAFILDRSRKGKFCKIQPMSKRSPDEHLTWYIINYFGFMTKPEWLANRAFIVQEKAKWTKYPELFEKYLTTDPEALALMTEGFDVFLRRVRDRILRDHPEKVFLNYCPQCGGLAKTPKAKQCHWCFYDWH